MWVNWNLDVQLLWGSLWTQWKLTFRNLQQWITTQCRVKILYTLSLSMNNNGIVIILIVLWALKSHSDGIKLSTGIWLSITAVYDVQLIQHCWIRCIRHEVRTVHYALFREDYLPVYSVVWPHCGGQQIWLQFGFPHSYSVIRHDSHHVIITRLYFLYLFVCLFVFRLILQVHHTVPTANGETLRVRFLHIAFDETGEMLAASDHRGNVFIIDLTSNK